MMTPEKKKKKKKQSRVVKERVRKALHTSYCNPEEEDKMEYRQYLKK